MPVFLFYQGQLSEGSLEWLSHLIKYEKIEKRSFTSNTYNKIPHNILGSREKGEYGILVQVIEAKFFLGLTFTSVVDIIITSIYACNIFWLVTLVWLPWQCSPTGNLVKGCRVTLVFLSLTCVSFVRFSDKHLFSHLSGIWRKRYCLLIFVLLLNCLLFCSPFFFFSLLLRFFLYSRDTVQAKFADVRLHLFMPSFLRN